MIQAPLEVYRIDMKYIRNLHNIDERVLSVSPQIGKDERPFLGVIVICNEHKYCVPLSKPKKKHGKMRDKIDFKKIVYHEELIGVLNFNLKNSLAASAEFEKDPKQNPYGLVMFLVSSVLKALDTL